MRERCLVFLTLFSPLLMQMNVFDEGFVCPMLPEFTQSSRKRQRSSSEIATEIFRLQINGVSASPHLYLRQHIFIYCPRNSWSQIERASVGKLALALCQLRSTDDPRVVSEASVILASCVVRPRQLCGRNFEELKNCVGKLVSQLTKPHQEFFSNIILG